jgi:leucine dehydrogenase
MQREHPEVKYVKPETIYSQEVDVFCPCALGGVLDDVTIPQIKAKVIAGSANNVLRDEKRDGDLLKKNGKVYAPDFVINSGGVINVYHELIGYEKAAVMREVELIYERVKEIFEIAKAKNINTQAAAIEFGKQRINSIAEIHKKFIPHSIHHR